MKAFGVQHCSAPFLCRSFHPELLSAAQTEAAAGLVLVVQEQSLQGGLGCSGVVVLWAALGRAGCSLQRAVLRVEVFATSYCCF